MYIYIYIYVYIVYYIIYYILIYYIIYLVLYYGMKWGTELCISSQPLQDWSLLVRKFSNLPVQRFYNRL